MYEFKVSKDFIEDFKKLDTKIADQVKAKLVWLNTLENPLHSAKKIQGLKDFYRFRGGDYRILAKVAGKTILLTAVAHRKEIYNF